MTQAPVLDVAGLTKRYDGQAVLADVSFALRPGEVAVLLGPSGAGKTTLFRCLARLIEPDEGAVRLFGRDMAGLDRGDLRRARRRWTIPRPR